MQYAQIEREKCGHNGNEGQPHPEWLAKPDHIKEGHRISDFTSNGQGTKSF
jgi:hypothetical protein